MMDPERLRVYLASLEPDPSPLIGEMEAYAAEHRVPIIRRETAAFLKTLVVLKDPGEILEVGTAIGYSALRMCEALGRGGRITTVEKMEERVSQAQSYIRRAGEESRIKLLTGDAAEVLATLAGPYDFIFLDAAKGQYLAMLPEMERLAAPGGVLVTDNIFQEGTVLESRFGVRRRDRTIHSRMREYLFQLKHRETWETALVPVGDGVAVSVRKRTDEENL